jgi:hypothetical protein
MHQVFVRRGLGSVTAFCALVALAACEDKRVKALDAGISRDSAVSVIAKDAKEAKGGGGPDSFPNVYTREQYLIAGKNYEILYFTPENVKRSTVNGTIIKDTLWKKLTPLVFVDNKMVAKGWDKWDSISNANKIPLKKR